MELRIEGERKYLDDDQIDMSGLSYDRWSFYDEEVSILQPRLEALGFTVLSWFSGESDSFGPLVRCARMDHPEHGRVTFVYG